MPSIAPTQSIDISSLSEQQFADYNRDGFLIIRGLLDPSEVNDLLQHADKMVAGEVPTDGFSCDAASQQTDTDPGRLIKQIKPTEFPLKDPILAHWYDHPILKAVISELIDCPNPEPFQQQILIKEPGESNATPWHQDDFYWKLSSKAATAWLPLVPASTQNGTMWMLPGSHKDEVLKHIAAGGVSKFHEIEQAIDEDKLIPLELNPGDVSFHHPRLIHGAKPNLGKKRRVSLAMHFRAPQPTS